MSKVETKAYISDADMLSHMKALGKVVAFYTEMDYYRTEGYADDPKKADEMQNFVVEVLQKGFGGVRKSNGELVDRRKHPFARKIPASEVLEIPSPVRVFGCIGCSFTGDRLYKLCLACLAKKAHFQKTQCR